MKSNPFDSTRRISRPSHRAAYFVLKKLQSEKGFSLLELVAVVVVLGILGSVTVPRIGNMIAAAQTDEAKALLNVAAAECLQKSRISSEDKDQIDETIISDTRLNTIGFQIDKANNSDGCSYFEIIPTDENDNIRFPLGFSVSNGDLSKFATPTSTDRGSINSCQRWAGINCKEGEGLKTLIDWKNSIEAAKNTCENQYSGWLTENNTQPRQFVRWNPNADKGCPSKPPANGSTSYMSDPTCTPNGCNRTVYGLDGKFVGYTETDYDRALEEKYGKACKEWVAQLKSSGYTNDPPTQPAELRECGGQKFWFYNGVDVGSKKEFDARLCSDNLDKEKGNPGRRTVAGCGNQVYYFCNNKVLDSEKDYKECSCDVDRYEAAQRGINGAFTTTETGATGCGNFWICNREIIDSEATYNERCPAAPQPPNDGDREDNGGGGYQGGGGSIGRGGGGNQGGGGSIRRGGAIRR